MHLRGRDRYELLIRTSNDTDIQKLIATLQNKRALPSNASIIVGVDALAMDQTL